MAEKNPVLVKQFDGGWVTEIISDALQVNMSPDLQNVDFSASGSVKKTWGYQELSTDIEDSVNYRLMVVPDREGVEWCFKKCGTKIKVHDVLLDRWDTVIEGLDATDAPAYEYFDGTIYFISLINDARKIDLYRSTRLVAETLLGATTVYVDNTTAFDSIGTFYLNGESVSYTGKLGTGRIVTAEVDTPGINYQVDDILTVVLGNSDATIKVTSINGSGGITGFSIETAGTGYYGSNATSLSGGSGSGGKIDITLISNTAGFSGCTGTPAAEDNSLVFGISVNVGGANQIPKGNVTAQYAGRLFVANGSTIYGSKLVVSSEATELYDFTVTGSGTGDGIEKTVESKCNALKVFYDDQNNLRLLSFAADNKIYVHDVLDDADLSSTIMTSSIFKDNVTALNQASTLVGPNNMYHIDARNQVRSLGQTYAAKGVNKVYSDSMSKYHESLFRNEYHFENARSVIIGTEYWCVCRQGDGAVNNRLIIFDFESGTWRLRTNVNANDIAIYHGNVIFADVSLNRVFEFDESLMSDDDESIYFKYSTPDLDSEKLRFERLRRVRIAGFISTNCSATIKLYADFRTKFLGDFIIRGNNTNIVGTSLGKDGSFGAVTFGDQMFGGDSMGLDIRFFIADLELRDLPDLENFRIIAENDESNVYFEVTAVKPFIMPMDENYWPPSKILQTTKNTSLVDEAIIDIDSVV